MHANNDLSERELEILRLVATGASNKQIAQQLLISTNTVKVHLKNIFSKIGAASRTEAAMYAVQNGIVPSGEISTAQDGEAVLSTPENWLSVSKAEPAGAPLIRVRFIFLTLATFLTLIIIGFFIVRNLANPLAGSSSPDGESTRSESRIGWKALASMPTSRWSMAICTYGGEIYAIGGENKQGVLDRNERYNPQLNSWMVSQPKPVAVADVQAALLNGKIYIPGGREKNGGVTSVLEIYDPRTDQWETGAHMPIGLSAYSMVAFEGRLYVFGGWDGERFINTVISYDPENNEWEEKTPMRTARGFTGATIANGKIYVLGGYNGLEAVDVNEYYQPNLEGIEAPWKKGTPLPFGLYAMGLVEAADIIHLVGGMSNQPGENPSLIYFPQSDEWSQFDTSPSSISRTYLGIAFLDQYIYVIGGLAGDEPSGLIQSYQVIYSVAIPLIR